MGPGGGPTKDNGPAARHHQLGGGLVHVDHTRLVGRKPADGRRQADFHPVASQNRGPHLQRGTDVLELHAGGDIPGARQVVPVERDLRIRHLARDEQRRFTAVLDERENTGRCLRPSLGAVHADTPGGASVPAIGDHHAPASLDRVAALCGRLSELEENLHLLTALGGDRIGPSGEEDGEQNESEDGGHLVSSLPCSPTGAKSVQAGL